MPFTDVTKNLIKQQSKEINDSTYFLSLYQPVDKSKVGELDKHLNSLVLSEFKSHEEIKDLKKFRNALIEKIIEKVDSLENKGRGIAVFVEFDTKEIKSDSKLELRENISDEKMTIVRLFREPEKETFIGKSFSLDQLIWANNNPLEALVIQVNRKDAQIYTVEGEEVEKLTEIKNKHITKEEKKFHTEFYPTRQSQVHHGEADNKLSRKEIKENRYFLQDISQFIREQERVHKGYDFLLVFYSSSFSELIGKFAEENSLRSSFEPILKEKIVNQERRLKQEVLEEVSKFEKKTKRELLGEAKNSGGYVNNWKEICEAARMERIKELFVEFDACKEGYVDKQGLVYLEEKKNNRPVKNIVPWILRRVIDSNGRVSLFREVSVGEQSKIAASLRY